MCLGSGSRGDVMVKYRIYEWEWDCINGEYVYRDYYGEEVEVEDEDELWEIVGRRLEEVVEEARENGWECEDDVEGSVICTKPCEDGEGEDECIYQHQVGFDIEEID